MEAGQTQGEPVVVQSQAVEAPAAPVAEAAAVEATEAEAAPPAKSPLSDREFAIENLRRLADADGGMDGSVQLRACELILVLGPGGAASSALVR